jgi:hypothetical protein
LQAIRCGFGWMSIIRRRLLWVWHVHFPLYGLDPFRLECAHLTGKCVRQAHGFEQHGLERLRHEHGVVAPFTGDVTLLLGGEGVGLTTLDRIAPEEKGTCSRASD